MNPTISLPVGRPKVARAKASYKSKITNGSAWLDGIDGRSAEARRFRDVLSSIISDLGGPDILSEAQRQLARRCALLSIECEKLEALGVRGEQIDLECYGMLTDRLGRCFQRLGLKRQQRDITPSLADILAEQEAAP
jgi:hypothetical protein